MPDISPATLRLVALQFALLFFAGSATAQSPNDLVVPIDWSAFNTEQVPTDDFSVQLATLLQRHSKYTLSEIARETGVPAYVAEDPLDCVAVGAGRALEHLPVFRDSLTPV